MRLLGKCPNCGAEDSIATREDPNDSRSWVRVICDACGKRWGTWLDLAHGSRTKTPLIPVEIEVNRRGVALEWPNIRTVHGARIIVMVLNAALMVRFKLEPCIATEGGVSGTVGKEPVELRNTYGKIGLLDENGFEESPECAKILAWYTELMRIVFEEEIKVGEKCLGRGAVLKLSPADPLFEDKLKQLLFLALWKKTGSKGFAEAVFGRLARELGNPLSGSYIAGLSDAEIARFFVPPPVERVTEA